MSINIIPFARLQRARSAQDLADNLIVSAEKIAQPDTELICAGLLQAVFQIADKTTLPGVRTRVAASLRSVAALLEIVDGAEKSAEASPL